MAEPFLGEIKIVSFNFAPKGWALANGQLLPINQNQALFSLFGTTYGGNGQTNFALPNMQGNVPVSQGNGMTMGERGGQTAHTLSIIELPQHIHFASFSTAAPNTDTSDNGRPASNPTPLYGPVQSLVPMAPNSLSNVGGSQAHNNMQPYLTLNFIVALQGIFPSQN